jgi:hypothetical protein
VCEGERVYDLQVLVRWCMEAVPLLYISIYI